MPFCSGPYIRGPYSRLLSFSPLANLRLIFVLAGPELLRDDEGHVFPGHLHLLHHADVQASPHVFINVKNNKET